MKISPLWLALQALIGISLFILGAYGPQIIFGALKWCADHL